jgi:hypothetical protein
MSKLQVQAKACATQPDDQSVEISTPFVGFTTLFPAAHL